MEYFLPIQLNYFDLIRFLVFLFLFIFIYRFVNQKKAKLPPGPTGLPIIGYLPFLGNKAYVTLHRLTLTYGPVFSLRLGGQRAVVLGSFESVKEALTNPNIMARPPHPPNHLLPNSISIATTSGKVWKDLKQFTLASLKSFGMNSSSLETIIQEEIQYFTDIIRQKPPGSWSKYLLPSVSNNIYQLLTGHRLNFGGKESIFMNEVFLTITGYFRPMAVHAYFPKLKPWLEMFNIWGYGKVKSVMTQFGTYVDDKVKEHVMKLDQGNKCYIDSFLRKIDETKGRSPSFTVGSLKGNILSLFGAGSGPALSALEWALACMVIYPSIQDKVREEIHNTLGKDKMPTWTDRKVLPYTLAVIMEILRSVTVFPISILRCASEDTKICGYDIPKGTIIVINIWGVHHHPKYWSDPEEFLPERFIQNGKTIKPESFIPFSYGKRNCPGEDMGIMLIFLYFARIMQKFKVTYGFKHRSFQEKSGITNMVIADNIHLIKDTT